MICMSIFVLVLQENVKCWRFFGHSLRNCWICLPESLQIIPQVINLSVHEHSLTAYSSKLGKMLCMIISSPTYNLFKRYRIIMSSSSIALPLLNFKKWITSGHTQKHSLLWSHENCTFLTYYLRPFCRTKRMHLSPKSEKISTRVKSQRFSKWYLVLYVCNKTKKGFSM